jgi:hypothetical protein
LLIFCTYLAVPRAQLMMTIMPKGNVTQLSSAVITDERLLAAMREGRVINVPELDYSIAPRTALIDLADEMAEEELLEEMVSYRKNVTGVSHTLFISPRGKTRHAPRIKVAISPSDSIDPRTETASIAITDGEVVAGSVPAPLLDQVRRFIAANRDALLDYWDYRIDTDQLRQRLKPI